MGEKHMRNRAVTHSLGEVPGRVDTHGQADTDGPG